MCLEILLGKIHSLDNNLSSVKGRSLRQFIVTMCSPCRPIITPEAVEGMRMRT